jgi:BirA family biotin operon repressor/biotin-[acetyl-CoA-carboxylase] ligase
LSNLTNTLFIGKVLLHFEELDSTNTYALNLLSKNKPSEGTVITAHNQSNGRGQIGRNWQSEPRKNLTISLILYPKFLPARQQFLLNQAIALGISDYLQHHFKDVQIKWPNDIYIGDRKICGILIQNILSGSSIQASVVGIGLNVNQTSFASDLPNPTSMAKVLKKIFNLDVQLAKLCECLEIRYLQLRSDNIALIQRDYLERLYRFQETALYKYPDGKLFSGQIVGVTDTGKLRIHHQRGEEQFEFREVIFVL